MTLKNIFTPSSVQQAYSTAVLNHLLVLYAFFMAISTRAQATIFFLMLIFLAYRQDFKSTLLEQLKNPIVQAFLLYFLIHIIWLIGTDDSAKARDIIKDASYTTYILIFSSFIDKRYVPRVIGAFLFGVFFSEIVSYLITLGFIPETLTLFDGVVYKSYDHGDPSPYLHHSAYALLLSFSLALIIYMNFSQKGYKRQKLFSIFFILSATANLFLVGGRVGYLIYLVLLMFLGLVLSKNKLMNFIALSILLVTSLVIAYHTSPLFKSRLDYSKQTLITLQKDSTNFNSSFGQRLGFWFYSGKTIQDNFLFGVGTADHMAEVHKHILLEKDKHLLDLSHPHNQFITTFLQFGIIGLFVFLNIFYQISRYKFPTNFQKIVAQLITISMFIALMFEYTGTKFYLPLWVLFISLAMNNEEYKLVQFSKISQKEIFIYLYSVAFIGIYTFLQGSETLSILYKKILHGFY